MKNITSHYSRRGLWSLFLMCAFPLHVWTLLFAFRDISWLWERTNLYDAIGVLCYGLFFAFIESLLVFGLAVLAGYLLSSKWSEEKRVILLGSFVQILAIWSMLFQFYNLQERELPAGLAAMLAGFDHPLRVLYFAALASVIPSIIIPAGLILFSEKFLLICVNLFDRLSLLTTVYLFLDAIAFLVVVVRNIQV